MSEPIQPTHKYPVVGPGGGRPPDYTRVARSLTDEDLEDEILSKRGDPGYQLALIAEHERRAKASP